MGRLWGRGAKDAGDTVPATEPPELDSNEGSVWGLLGPLGYRRGREHSTSKHCWCQPVLDYVDQETGVQVWVHQLEH
jgi:hypothetical protein